MKDSTVGGGDYGGSKQGDMAPQVCPMTTISQQPSAIMSWVEFTGAPAFAVTAEAIALYPAIGDGSVFNRRTTIMKESRDTIRPVGLAS